MKVETVFEVARSVRDSLGPPPLEDAFGSLVVKEGVDAVVPQLRLVLDCKANVVYIPLLINRLESLFRLSSVKTPLKL